ncbi:hypothetical protein [Bradyrhizobium sp. CW4]|uniref:hypothetical protein n=1 Tax=Bradyrhizobium sp. CW4 TaxID=2782687 RepID=UPI001FF922CC|nr:hypothetical protein [Bradyrhizobium sp. CW4]
MVVQQRHACNHVRYSGPFSGFVSCTTTSARRKHRPGSRAPDVIFRDIAPQSAIEWLLAIDVAELSRDAALEFCGTSCWNHIDKKQ